MYRIKALPASRSADPMRCEAPTVRDESVAQSSCRGFLYTREFHDGVWRRRHLICLSSRVLAAPFLYLTGGVAMAHLEKFDSPYLYIEREEFKMFTRILGVLLCALFISPGSSMASDRSGEVELAVTIAAPDDSTDVRDWIPYPVSDNVQDISNVRISGNFSQSGVYGEKETGNLALYAEWTTPTKDRAITLTFDATARELIKKDFPAAEPAIPVEIKEHLKSTTFIPTDGKDREIVLSATNI